MADCNPNNGTSKFSKLLIASGIGEAAAKVIFDKTKLAFQNKLLILEKAKNDAELKIKALEDLSEYRTGNAYNPIMWIDEAVKLEGALKAAKDAITLMKALNKEYFTEEGDGTPNPNPTPGTLTFAGALSGSKEVPPVYSAGSGNASLSYNTTTKVAVLTVNYAGLTPNAAHIHKGAVGADGDVVFTLDHTKNPIMYTSAALTAAQEADLKAGLYYVNLHTVAQPDGEIRGQLVAS